MHPSIRPITGTYAEAFGVMPLANSADADYAFQQSGYCMTGQARTGWMRSRQICLSCESDQAVTSGEICFACAQWFQETEQASLCPCCGTSPIANTATNTSVCEGCGGWLSRRADD